MVRNFCERVQWEGIEPIWTVRQLQLPTKGSQSGVENLVFMLSVSRHLQKDYLPASVDDKTLGKNSPGTSGLEIKNYGTRVGHEHSFETTHAEVLSIVCDQLANRVVMFRLGRIVCDVMIRVKTGGV